MNYRFYDIYLKQNNIYLLELLFKIKRHMFIRDANQNKVIE